MALFVALSWRNGNPIFRPLLRAWEAGQSCSTANSRACWCHDDSLRMHLLCLHITAVGRDQKYAVSSLKRVRTKLETLWA